ncbi:MAG: DUF4389 domain-containing protein [Oligoflexales bacterium]
MENFDEIKANIKDRSTWVVGFFILVFLLLGGLAKAITCVLALFQFIHTLITREPNAHLIRFGRSLSEWIYQIALYVTFNSAEKPFPFSDWPKPL